MSTDTHQHDTHRDTVIHAPEGSVFDWPEFELNYTVEPLETDGTSVYYFYPRQASDRVLEREWLMAAEDVVVDIVNAR
jgi:hypothetical protein